MKPNTDSDTTANLKGASASARRVAPPRRPMIPPSRAIERDPDAFRAWQIEQEDIEAKRNEAWSAYPPGTKLFVTTARGIPRRGRAGVVFSRDARTEVLVVNHDPETIADLRSAKILTDGDLDKAADKAGVSREEAVAIRGNNVVSPLGAKEIAEDDGLQTFKSAGENARDDRDDEIETLRAENAKLAAELGKARKARETNPTAPTRLAQGTAAGAKSEDFGGADADGKEKK